MLCEFGEILLNVAASCEQTITNRVTGEIITLIDNQGDRSNRTRLRKSVSVSGGIFRISGLMLCVFGEIRLMLPLHASRPYQSGSGEIITLIDIQGDQRKTGPGLEGE